MSTKDTVTQARATSPDAQGVSPAAEVPSVAEEAPVVTPEVPLVVGDVLREIKTPAVSPPNDPLADAVTTAVGSPQAGRSPEVEIESPETSTASPKEAPTRRISAGAALAEKVGIDLNAISRGTLVSPSRARAKH